MFLYAKRVKQTIIQHTPPNSTGDITVKSGDNEFKFSGPMGWAGLFLLFLVVIAIVIGKYGKAIKSFFGKDKRHARKTARATKRKKKRG